MAENEKTPKKGRRTLIIWGAVALVAIAAILSGVYYYVSSQSTYIDESTIQAPIINLSPTNSGNLQAVFVQAGDTVTVNEPVARVGNEIVEAKTDGIIVTVDQNIGEYENAFTGQAIVATMIDPTQLRVVGHLDENKGLADIHVGDQASFTVDAFGGQTFHGIVDEVSPSSKQTSVVFDISGARPTNQFDIYVRFDPSAYPQLKNGMSARIWVYKK